MQLSRGIFIFIFLLFALIVVNYDTVEFTESNFI